jgi:glycine/D-amino acid oxidase-like deaminating enzyme
MWSGREATGRSGAGIVTAAGLRLVNRPYQKIADEARDEQSGQQQQLSEQIEQARRQSEEIRQQRLAARHWSRAEQEARETAWNLKYTAAGLATEKISTVDASGDLAYTQAQVDSIWSGLSG